MAGALNLSSEEQAQWRRARKRLAARSASNTHSNAGQSRTHLPAPLTTFVGREQEIINIANVLHGPDTRLMTLTGAGGVGKTRLALMVARQIADAFPDGVWFVDLAPLSDPSLVLPSVASTLTIPVSGNQPALTALVDALTGKRVLLLLDNVEQVVQSARHIATLVSACPNMTVLATSRTPLHVQGEWEYPVSPLELPEHDHVPDIDRLLRFEAVALFVQRAQAIRPDFRLTDDNAQTIADICRRLDGIPLAIELAAARIRLLSPHTMLQRLDHRLSLLTGGALDLPPRQQTLRNTIAWSYDLLTPDEQRLFRQLSVFRGGWTFEAAEAVKDDGINALDGLERLVEHSLVRVREQTGGESRYSMLETIREYGLERLAEEGQEEHAHVRHGHYFLQLAETAAPELWGHAGATWMTQLEAELDNLRVALTWFIEQDDEAACRLGGALYLFFGLHGHIREGRRWLETILAQSQPVPPAVRARVLEGLGVLAYMQSDYPSARAAGEEALAIWQALGERSGTAWMLHLRGRVAYETGDYSRAESTYDQALGMYRQLGDSHGIADMLNVLGVIASAVFGEHDRARSLYEESLELRRKIGDLIGISQSLSNLGWEAMETGDYRRARSLCEESLALLRKHNLTGSGGIELLNLGTLALRQGDGTRAMTLLAENIRMFQEDGDTKWVVECLIPLAELAAHHCQLTRVPSIAGAIEAIAAQTSMRFPPQEQIAYDRVIAAARSQVNVEDWTYAWDRGRAMSLDEAVDYALSDRS